MSPYEHGEVYVMDDGGEVDLDLGNYERFLNVSLCRKHNITTGKVYRRVLDTERRGDYLGKTVQIVPHVTNCIQDWIQEAAQIPVDSSKKTPDVCVIELGGTVGDLESGVFLEAIRQFKFRFGDNICHVHVSLIPALGNVGELKSKPTQHSMVQLRSTGLIPDLVVLRCSKQVPQKIINKVSIFSMVPKTHIIGVHDVSNIYQVPQLLLTQGVEKLIFKKIGFGKAPKIDLTEWNKIGMQLSNDDKEMDYDNDDDIFKNNIIQNVVTIGLVGKYTGLTDSYLSVTKALLSAALDSNLKLQIVWIESTHLEHVAQDENVNSDNLSELSRANTPSIETQEDKVHNISTFVNKSPDKKHNSKHENRLAWDKLESVDGILIPGGFGDRGIEGKILAVNYAREKKIPFLGICLGLQVAVAEFCRNILGWKGANSSEFDENTKYPCVIFMPEGDKENYGGTMRLGSRVCKLQDKKKQNNKSLAKYLYGGKKEIYERHRHRYEVNPKMVDQIESKGLLFTGKDDKNERMEIFELELKQHPFFFGCQFHPEYKSGPLRPSPPFQGLIKAASGLLYKEKGFIKQFGNIKKEKLRRKSIDFSQGKASYIDNTPSPTKLSNSQTALSDVAENNNVISID